MQTIADAINNGPGINLSNLGSNTNLLGGLANILNGGSSSNSQSSGFDLASLGTNAGLLSGLASLVGGNTNAAQKAPPPDDSGESLTELVGNLLTGFVGSRFSGRKIEKRSIEFSENDDDDNTFAKNGTISDNERNDEENESKKLSAFKRKLNSTFKEQVSNDDGEGDEAEARIINTKPEIYAYENDRITNDPDRFTFNSDSNRPVNNHQFVDRITAPTPLPTFSYPNQNNQNNQDNRFISFQNDNYRFPSNNRSPKLVEFYDSQEQNAYQGANNDDSNRLGPHTNNKVQFESNFYQRPSKMIFPDRTGTGNLKFDHDEFQTRPNKNRYGKILYSGGSNQQQQFNNNNYNGNRVSFNQNDDRNDRYRSEQNYRPSLNNNNQNYDSGSSSYTKTNRYTNQNYNSNDNYNQPNRRYPTYNRYGNSGSNYGSNTNSGSSSYRGENSSQNVYVTNSQGKTEYYINAQGKKVYI